MDAQEEERLNKLFSQFDKDKSGLIDMGELQELLFAIMGNPKVDVNNAQVLMRRYDMDKKGKLNLEEFKELFLMITHLQKNFFLADADRSRTLSVKEISTILTQLNLKVSAKSLGPVLKLYDSAGKGSIDFQEYLSLVFFFQELEYQYDTYKEPKENNYQWVVPLLGTDGQKKSVSVIKDLKAWKDKKKNVTLDDFVKLFVEELEVSAFVRFFTGKKKNAPKIEVVRDRNRIRAPNRHIKMVTPTTPAVQVEEVTKKIQSIKVSPKGIWNDPDFVLNDSILPDTEKETTITWKRPKEISANASLFVQGTEEGDVIQGRLGDCWFLGALAVVAASTDNYIEHLFAQQNPEQGYYQCRFYKNGKWHLVDVDDRLPCDEDGLIFASCRDPNEFWVPIVEKAYAKLHGSYHALEKGSITDGLKDLTGESVEIMQLDSPAFLKKNIDLWATLKNNIKEGFMMGCSQEAGGLEQEAELQNGILANHAYSLIDCQEVGGNRLVRIRNPWGRGEWTGDWSDQSKKWTPELLKQMNYTLENDGTFFMEFSDFQKNYNRLCVLRLLGQAWSKSTFMGEFKGKSAGGNTAHPSWVHNPQYALTLTQPTRVFLNVSQPDLRMSTKVSPGVCKEDYAATGIVVLKSGASVDHKKNYFKLDEKTATSPFAMMRDNSLEFVGGAGNYVIIPCTFTPGFEFPYEFTVYTEHKNDAVKAIEKTLPGKTLKGAWKGKLAGGCQNEPTWMNNPQFLLTVSAPGTVIVSVTQLLHEKQKLDSVGIYVFSSSSSTRMESKPTREERVVMANDFLDVVVVAEEFAAKTGVTYIVMPTTFDARVEMDFEVNVSSAVAVIEKFETI